MTKDKIKRMFELKINLKKTGCFAECFKDMQDEYETLKEEYMNDYFRDNQTVINKEKEEQSQAEAKLSYEEMFNIFVNAINLALNFELRHGVTLDNNTEIKIDKNEYEALKIKRVEALRLLSEILCDKKKQF